MFSKRTLKVFLIAIVVFSFVTVAYASAAANTVDLSKAGDGSGTITGYTIQNVEYTLNTNNPNLIDSVTFKTTESVTAGSTVTIKLVAAGSTWYTCTGQGSTDISCTTTGASVLAADDLRIVIAN